MKKVKTCKVQSIWTKKKKQQQEMRKCNIKMQKIQSKAKQNQIRQIKNNNKDKNPSQQVYIF